VNAIFDNILRNLLQGKPTPGFRQAGKPTRTTKSAQGIRGAFGPGPKGRRRLADWKRSSEQANAIAAAKRLDKPSIAS
jgi:hypothetical protein